MEPQRSWLVRTTAVDRLPPPSPTSQAALSKMYKDWEVAKEEREKKAKEEREKK